MSKENLSKNIAKTIGAIAVITSLTGCRLQIKSSMDILIESDKKSAITSPDNNCSQSIEENGTQIYPEHFYDWQGPLPVEDPSKTRA